MAGAIYVDEMNPRTTGLENELPITRGELEERRFRREGYQRTEVAASVRLQRRVRLARPRQLPVGFIGMFYSPPHRLLAKERHGVLAGWAELQVRE